MHLGARNLIFCLFSFGEMFLMTQNNLPVAQTSVCADFALATSDAHRLKPVLQETPQNYLEGRATGRSRC